MWDMLSLCLVPTSMFYHIEVAFLGLPHSIAFLRLHIMLDAVYVASFTMNCSIISIKI